VIARITPGGRTLLARLDEPVQEIHLKQLGHLGRNGLGALGELLRAARASVGCFFSNICCNDYRHNASINCNKRPKRPEKEHKI
jgi:hypothetical protein